MPANAADRTGQKLKSACRQRLGPHDSCQINRAEAIPLYEEPCNLASQTSAATSPDASYLEVTRVQALADATEGPPHTLRDHATARIGELQQKRSAAALLRQAMR